MPVGAPSTRGLVRDIESKIDFTVIPGISAIESKLDQWDLPAVDEMLSAIESKLDKTLIVDIDDIQEMLSAIESKIDLTVIPGISALESKLDLLDLAAVDEMLSAIESKIDVTLIPGISLIESKLDFALPDIQTMLSAIESKIDKSLAPQLSAVEDAIEVIDDEVSLIESKLDAGLPDIVTILGLVDSAEAVGPFNYLDAGGEQDVYEDAVTTRRRIWIVVSNRNMTQTGTFIIYRMVDGANYDVYITQAVTIGAGDDRAWDAEFTINQNWKITYEEDVDEGANRDIPYNVITQVIE